MIPKDCKRLAEVDFPIAEVSRHAAREKSIRHGHPSTLHLWWARRPLASSRAVLLGAAVAGPVRSAVPGGVQGRRRGSCLPQVLAADPGTTDEDLRKALLKFIADFANWDNAAHRTLPRGEPRAGEGGACPAEGAAARWWTRSRGAARSRSRRCGSGCEAFASDLNPVACLILKVMLEDIPRARAGARRGAAPRRGGDQAAGGEGAGRPLSEGPGRRDAHRLPLGADRALRVAELRRGDPARAVVLAVQEDAKRGAHFKERPMVAAGAAERPLAGVEFRGARGAEGSSSRMSLSVRGTNARNSAQCDLPVLRRGPPARARGGPARGAARRGGRCVRREGPAAPAGRGCLRW